MIAYSSLNFSDHLIQSFERHNFSIVGSHSDAEIKAIIQASKLIQKPDKLTRIVRIDGIDDSSIGYVSCLGTKAVLAERIVSALHHFNSGAITAIVFICDSEEMAWWKQNSTKTKPSASDGNRSSAKDLLNHLATLNWIELPIMVYSICSSEATEAFNSFHRI